METETVPKLCVRDIAFDENTPDRVSLFFPHGLEIAIIKTPEGYVVDAYHADGQMLSTLNV